MPLFGALCNNILVGGYKKSEEKKSHYNIINSFKIFTIKGNTQQDSCLLQLSTTNKQGATRRPPRYIATWLNH